MSVKQAPEYKGILVAVTGLTPQVVTETLYCLTVKRELARERPFVPARIVLLTTGEGRRKAEDKLKGNGGWLRKFGKHYGRMLGVEEDAFDRATEVKPIVNTEDVADTAASEAAATGVLKAVRQLIKDDTANETAIIASVAGGRATMGYLLGYALSIYGREQDRMTHVLVTDQQLEGVEDFFFPYPDERAVMGNRNEYRYPGQSSLELTEIPFLPARYWVQGEFEDLLQQDREFHDLVREIHILATTEPRLVIQKNVPTIECGGVKIDLHPMEFAVYYYLANCHVEGNPLDIVALNKATQGNPGHVANVLLEFYPEATSAQVGENRWTEIKDQVWKKSALVGDCSALILNNLASVRGKIQAAFPGHNKLADPYLDRPLGKKRKGKQEGENLRPRVLGLSPDAVEIHANLLERG